MMFVRAEWCELLGWPLDLRFPDRTTSSVQAALIIDAKSAYDAIKKGDGASSGFSLKKIYAGLTLLAVTENLQHQGTMLLWVSSEAQLADSLTKASAAEMVQRFLQNGQQWVVRYDPLFWRPRRSGSSQRWRAT